MVVVETFPIKGRKGIINYINLNKFHDTDAFQTEDNWFYNPNLLFIHLPLTAYKQILTPANKGGKNKFQKTNCTYESQRSCYIFLQSPAKSKETSEKSYKTIIILLLCG